MSTAVQGGQRAAVYDLDGTLLDFGPDRYRVLEPAVRAALAAQRLRGWTTYAATSGEAARTLHVLGTTAAARNRMHVFASGGREQMAPGASTAALAPSLLLNAIILRDFFEPCRAELAAAGAVLNAKAAAFEVDWEYIGTSARRRVERIVEQMAVDIAAFHAEAIETHYPSSHRTTVEFRAIPITGGAPTTVDKGTVMEAIQTAGAREIVFMCDDTNDIAGAWAIRRMVRDGRLERGRVIVVESGRTTDELRALATRIVTPDQRVAVLRELAAETPRRAVTEPQTAAA